MSSYVLRPRRAGKKKAMVSHLFTDDDYWWPYRSAACGREYAADRLSDVRLHVVPLCQQCATHLPKEVAV